MNELPDNTNSDQDAVAVPMSRSRRTVLGVAGATAVAGAVMVISAVGGASTAGAAPLGPQDNIGICHATPPATAANGWNAISPNANSIAHGRGHDLHALDIIPAFTITLKGGGTLDYPGKNLTTVFGGATGAEILANGCVIPTPTDTETVTGTVTNTATATETETATETVTNTATETETAVGTETEVVTTTAAAGAGGQAAGGAAQGPIPAGVNAGLHTPDSNAGLKAWGILLMLLGGAAGLIFGLRPAGRRAH